MQSFPAYGVNKNISEFKLDRISIFQRAYGNYAGRAVFYNPVRAIVFAQFRAIQQLDAAAFDSQVMSIESVKTMPASQVLPLSPGRLLLRQLL